MASFEIDVGGQRYHVELSGQRQRVEGEQHAAELVPLEEPNTYLLKDGRQAFEVVVVERSDGGYELLIDGERFEAELAPERRTGTERPEENRQGEDGELSAPMPGLVVKVPAGQGKRVAAGEPLVILSSMKMQLQIRAPKGGVVREVLVKDGQQVEKGSVLVRLDLEEEL
jgi:biotin carboxyl carrier protein